MGVKFDYAGCIKALRLHIIETLKLIQEEYLEEIQSHMQTPRGREDLTAEEIEIVGTFITAQIIGGAWATMDEWGTGSSMDISNPALPAYRNSELWNPARHDTVIRGRPAGSYTNIFGEGRTSSGKLEGVNLEWLSAQGVLPFEVDVIPPSHAMQTAGRWLKNGRIQAIWLASLGKFPWGKFIIATPD